MSKLDRATVEHIASLAQLRLSEEELPFFQDQLGQIIDYMDQLREFDDHLDRELRADLLFPVSPEREDSVSASSVIDKVLMHAPRVVGSAFQVPRILE